MVAHGSACIRRLGDGDGAKTKRFRRFLANDRVSLDRLIEGWADRTGPAAAGRHVLAIQDTSEIQFRTSRERTRGLGEIGKGFTRGALLHAMLAVDADSGACLGLVGGRVWTRAGRIKSAHAKRGLAEKESERWLQMAERAKTVLSAAATVTVIADRESDIYAEWATLPAPGLHLLTRVMQDRRLFGGGMLYAFTAALPAADRKQLLLPRRGTDPKLQGAEVELRFAKLSIQRPGNTTLRSLPQSVPLTVIEVLEPEPPEGSEPLHWRLLTTHEVPDVATAWRMVDYYKRRWIIEQFFRVLKTQGFRIEDSQIDSASVLLRLVAVAAKAAAITIQLLQARDGAHGLAAAIAFSDTQTKALNAINRQYQARNPRQNNPHPHATLAWASWIIARLGGWDGYPSSRPPGPITFKTGIDHFLAIAQGWTLRDVSTP